MTPINPKAEPRLLAAPFHLQGGSWSGGHSVAAARPPDTQREKYGRSRSSLPPSVGRGADGGGSVTMPYQCYTCLCPETRRVSFVGTLGPMWPRPSCENICAALVLTRGASTQYVRRRCRSKEPSRSCAKHVGI